MRITIIGCGNSGLIHAAKIHEKGYKVGLLKTSSYNSEYFEKIKSDGEYKVVDETNHGNIFITRPEFITRDVQKAVDLSGGCNGMFRCADYSCKSDKRLCHQDFSGKTFKQGQRKNCRFSGRRFCC